MPVFTMYNAAGSGFDMAPTNSGGWSYVQSNPNVQSTLVAYGDKDPFGNKWEEYSVSGAAVENYMLVEYWTDGYNISASHLMYGILYTDNTIDKTLEITGLDLKTTISDLNSNAWFVNITSGNDTFNGNDYFDSIRAGLGNDVVFGFGGYDVLSGDAGNDVLYGGGGNDILFGGVGIDTAGFGNYSFNYSFSINPDGSLTVTDIAGSGFGSDTLYDIEYLSFNNGTFAISSFTPILTQPEQPVVLPPTTIETTTSITLPAGVKNVVAKGAANIKLTGNALDNSLTGNVGKNAINGGGGNDKLNGGYGNDTLTGSTGKNAFLFTTKLGTSTTDRKVNFDTATDFSVKDDSIWLDNAIFKKLGSGSASNPKLLSKSSFAFETAKDKNDYMIYNKKTGILSYDVDGSGSKAAVEFAQLKKGLALTYKDFFVI